MNSNRPRQLPSLRYQFTVWLTIAILVLQLVGMAFHNHGLAEESDDCVSCNLAAVFPAPAAPPPVVAPAPIPVIVYHIALEPVYAFVPEARTYLIPYPHAPPRVSSPV